MASPINNTNQTLALLQQQSVPTAFPASLSSLKTELVNLARDHAKHPAQKIPVVGIGGCPGIGKTIFTKLLAKEFQTLGISHRVVLFDDWTNPAERRQKGYFDLEGVHAFFAAFQEGKELIEKPTSAEFEDLYSTEVLDLRKVDIILFEGLFTLSGKDPMNYARYCDKGIYLDASRDDIWRWKRDRPSTVQRTEEEFAKHMEAVFKALSQDIEPFKSQATWIVRKDADHGYSL
jgi:uridine kinase